MTPIVYGFPGPEMWEAAERGEIELGGCCIGGELPVFVCWSCGRTTPRPDDEWPQHLADR